MKKSILATAIVSLYAPTLFAQDSESTQVDETMVVTANRFEQTQTSALASVSVVEREQIEQLQADSAYDVLKTLPGVEITSQGTKAATNSVFIRGSNSNQTLILLDGVRLNTAAGGTANTLGLIPAFAIERIELVRGPRASVYGADAIGGVISIITKPADASVHELTLNGGSNNYHQEAWRSVGDISESTKGNFVASNEGSKGYNITDQNTDNKYGYQSQFINGGISTQINKNWSAGFNGVYQNYENQYVSSPTSTPNLQETDAYILSGNVGYSREDFSSSLQVNYSNEQQSDGEDSLSAPAALIESKRTSVLWVNTYKGIDNLVLNGGVDYSYEEASNSGYYIDFLGNVQPVSDFDENSRNNTGIFGTVAVEQSSVLFEASVRHDENSMYGGNTTWGLAAGWNITEQLMLNASYGTAFKAPAFFDLATNPDLKPEESESYEVGLAGYYSFLTWNLTAYQNNIENLFTWVSNSTPPNYGSLENINEAEIKGIELSLDFDTGPVTHTLVGDWKDPQDKTTGEQLIRRAKQNYKWIMNYGYEALNLSLSTIYTGERPDANGTLDSYVTIDVAASYHITDNLLAKLKVDNLLDEDYETSEGFGFNYVGPERSYYAGIDYRF
ncbi:TonB-dependent receptor domain-containing protein [Vibrio comitans]|uniref:Vitamin B12 transporter BtuB n=1 Tax=Vibrio comitans NBRC 102076 TaxID=1219078 RepID=A0A4Y3IKT4_9VIBR|nr:TonB-dependent receptor [Vibrio comitans]GEA60071.1 vitamin B12 transporter BtuB [Vibrio comitans NBRC 102076]